MAEGPEQQRRVRREPPPGEDRPEIRRRLSAERDELNPDPTSTDDEMEALRQDIARTRAEMSESVYALQERMNPQYIRQQATSQIRQGASDRAKGASSGGNGHYPQQPRAGSTYRSRSRGARVVDSQRRPRF